MTVERRPYRSSKEVVAGGGVERLQPPIVENEKIGAPETT